MPDSSRSHPAASPRQPRSRAFTLIELLVVVAIIALVAGGLGLAISDTAGSGLASGQTALASMVNTARTQAAVHQAATRLMIYATRPPSGDKEKYLRLMQVFRAEPPDQTSNFVPVGQPIVLPRGIYVVPTSVSGLLVSGVIWPTNPPLLSSLAGPVGVNQPAGTLFANSTAFYLQFAPDGTVSSPSAQPYARLLVATATVVNDQPQFNNAGAARGILIRPSGGITFVNDANSF